jgi:hypothetical protein
MFRACLVVLGRHAAMACFLLVLEEHDKLERDDVTIHHVFLVTHPPRRTPNLAHHQRETQESSALTVYP